MKNYVIVSLIFLTTFQNLFYNLLPINIFGVSIYLVFFVSILLFFFILNHKRQSSRNLFYYSLFLIFYVAFFYFRHSAYNYDNLLDKLLKAFTWYLVPIIILLTSIINQKSFKSIQNTLLIILIFQSILSLFFIVGLPTINLLTEEHTFAYIRYVGIMSGANVNANFNALIVSVLVLGSNYYNNRSKFLFICLGVLSVIPSLSRLPLLILLLLLFYLIRIQFTKSIYMKFLIFSSFLIVGIIAANNTKYLYDIGTINRIANTIEVGSDQVRSEKYAYGFSILFSDYSSILVGPPKKLQEGRFIEFSDNSYLHMALELGLPMFILYLLLLIRFIKHQVNRFSIELKLYIFIILITCLLNNSILWIPWLFIYFVGLNIINRNNLLKIYN